MTKLRVFCAWCGEFIREIDGGGQSGESHGICDKCLKIELRKIKEGQKANESRAGMHK